MVLPRYNTTSRARRRCSSYRGVQANHHSSGLQEAEELLHPCCSVGMAGEPNTVGPNCQEPEQRLGGPVGGQHRGDVR